MTHGARVGTRCGSSRRLATTACPASASPPRVVLPDEGRDGGLPGDLCRTVRARRCEPAVTVRPARAGREIGSSSRPAAVGSRRTTSSSRPGRIVSRAARVRDASSTRSSCRCIRAITAGPRNSRTGPSCSSAPGTRVPRSRSRSSRTHRTWFAGKETGQIPRPDRAIGRGRVHASSASSATTCSRSAHRWAARPVRSSTRRATRSIRVQAKELSPRRRRTRRPGGGCARRPPAPRGRAVARGGERDLVHGVPPATSPGSISGLRGGRRARCTTEVWCRPSQGCTSSDSPFQYSLSSRVLPGIGRDHALRRRNRSRARTARHPGDRAPVRTAA